MRRQSFVGSEDLRKESFFRSFFSRALRITRESFAGPLPLPVEGVKLKLRRRRLPTITYPSFLLHFSSLFPSTPSSFPLKQLNELYQLPHKLQHLSQHPTQLYLVLRGQFELQRDSPDLKEEQFIKPLSILPLPSSLYAFFPSHAQARTTTSWQEQERR